MKWYASVSGTAWLAMESDKAPLQLEAGDGVLLPNGRRVVLARDVPHPAAQLRQTTISGCTSVTKGGDDRPRRLPGPGHNTSVRTTRIACRTVSTGLPGTYPRTACSCVRRARQPVAAWWGLMRAGNG
ncbi:cupin domain-containing protein [Sodalis sp. RH22]|uniref:cupin domain-containing protein n=1 Tax=Sodalis sp. RH22 TaxID=3394337 RepID=UPI0039B64F98